MLIFAVANRKTENMKKQDTIEMLRTLFNDLSDSAKVEVMVEFYYSLGDYRKDEFLLETENA